MTWWMRKVIITSQVPRELPSSQQSSKEATLNYLTHCAQFSTVLRIVRLLCSCSWVGPVLQEVLLFLSFLGGGVIASNCTCVLQVPTLSPCQGSYGPWKSWKPLEKPWKFFVKPWKISLLKKSIRKLVHFVYISLQVTIEIVDFRIISKLHFVLETTA